MLDPKFVLDNKDFVLRKIASRGIAINLDEFSRLSEEKKQVLRRVEELRFERNKASEQIAQDKREKKDASDLIARMREVGDRIKTLEEELRQID